jgi:lipopolysaccharide cholinephosphotransferase
MKLVSDEMVDAIAKVCNDNGISYHVAALTDKAVRNSFPEITELWTAPKKILMLRKDYDRFAEVAQEALGNKYFYQSHETDPLYYYSHACVRMNLTSLHDRMLRVAIEQEIHDGFYVEIIPLDNCPSGKAGKEYIDKVREYNHDIKLKWITRSHNTFMNLNKADKAEYSKIRKMPIEELYDRAVKAATSYKEQDTDYCYDSSFKLAGKVFKKSDIADKTEVKVLNKENYKAKNIDEFVEGVWGSYGACYLNYYDIPDYQLSILRYDEKEDRLLTVEEILDMEAK